VFQYRSNAFSAEHGSTLSPSHGLSKPPGLPKGSTDVILKR